MERLTRQAKCSKRLVRKSGYTLCTSEITDGVYNADLTETALWDDYKEKDLY